MSLEEIELVATGLFCFVLLFLCPLYLAIVSLRKRELVALCMVYFILSWFCVADFVTFVL